MTQQAKDFILYMYQQFPATVGHIPMKEMIEKIEQGVRLSALDEAADMVDDMRDGEETDLRCVRDRIKQLKQKQL